ncbi:MAG: hypothetical protein B6D70_14200, partial [gamma proteobacterium symbiont of Stewartia floridana]
MMRHLSPTGSPIKFSEFAGWLANVATGRNQTEALLQLAKGVLGMDAGFLFSTGRGAMTALLA